MNEFKPTTKETKLLLINEVETQVFRVKMLNELLGDTLCNNDECIKNEVFEKLILLYNLIDEKLEEANKNIETLIKDIEL